MRIPYSRRSILYQRPHSDAIRHEDQCEPNGRMVARMTAAAAMMPISEMIQAHIIISGSLPGLTSFYPNSSPVSFLRVHAAAFEQLLACDL
eukprot:scaffold6361_cov50-Attheya_sp.AAC.2